MDVEGLHFLFFFFLSKGKDDVYMVGMTLCRLLRFRNV